MPDNLPDDPPLLKQMLGERQVDKGQIVDLKEQIKLLRDRLLDRKSEQTVDPQTTACRPAAHRSYPRTALRLRLPQTHHR
jgi:hypothetical protein